MTNDKCVLLIVMIILMILLILILIICSNINDNTILILMCV